MLKRIEPNPNAQPQTHANAILSGDDLFIAGQVGIDRKTGATVDGIASQAKVALENIEAIVTTAGGGIGDVAKLTIFVADMEAFAAHAAELQGAIFSTFPDGYLPAISLIGVTALLSPEYLIEIEGHAKIGGSS